VDNAHITAAFVTKRSPDTGKLESEAELAGGDTMEAHRAEGWSIPM
jgi:hypothetical protein